MSQRRNFTQKNVKNIAKHPNSNFIFQSSDVDGCSDRVSTAASDLEDASSLNDLTDSIHETDTEYVNAQGVRFTQLQKGNDGE